MYNRSNGFSVLQIGINLLRSRVLAIVPVHISVADYLHCCCSLRSWKVRSLTMRSESLVEEVSHFQLSRENYSCYRFKEHSISVALLALTAIATSNAWVLADPGKDGTFMVFPGATNNWLKTTGLLIQRLVNWSIDIDHLTDRDGQCFWGNAVSLGLNTCYFQCIW